VPTVTSPGILIRRVNYGDTDVILTYLTPDHGKITVIAKSAKKSVKRFSGVLELFAAVELVHGSGRKSGLSVLREVAMREPFDGIRADITRTAYASYWAEIIKEWVEEGHAQPELYHLLHYVLSQLDAGCISVKILSILFQLRFLNCVGLAPNLTHCQQCRLELEKIPGPAVWFDFPKGGIYCEKCMAGPSGKKRLAKGTLKQLIWMATGDPGKVTRIRFGDATIKETLELLEPFLVFHLGREIHSLKFLRQLRAQNAGKLQA
jgi:DNA repair protein RecO (recombination protein O)